ncbi:MAG: tRNA (N6-isopentenyl adenosine(37)-C2)-methylthiotransferase MiaB, partial [Chloroflexi bacterium]|nr:tRNA (N6-isopentenyl adenosine(37)-C2)-methylthiotransferase MiaB [Chloroflexota bacterium]
MQHNTVKPHRYYIWTIVCQINKSDSERLARALDTLGLEECGMPKEADVVVLNSCVVRQSAEDKVTGMLSSLKPLKQRNPQRIVALMGCMVGPQVNGLKERFPYVDVFMRPQQYEPLIHILGERLDVDVDGCLRDLAPLKPQVTTYVPVIHGC